MNKRNEKYAARQLEKDNLLSWYILLGAVLFVPLLIGFAMFEFYSPTMMGSISDTGMKAEIFTTYKWYALLFFTAASLLWFITRLLSGTVKIPQNYFTLLLGVLFLLATLSLLAAEYKSIALYGLYDMRDGTLSFFCFLLLAFIASSCQFPLKLQRPLMIVFTIFLAVNCLLGVLLLFGINLTSYPWFLKLLSFGNDVEVSSRGQIFGTMSNPNYLSALASALLAFFMVYFIKIPHRKHAALLLLPIISGFSVVLTSISSSGVATLAVAVTTLVFLGFFTAASRREYFIRLAVLLILFSGMFGLYSIKNPALPGQIAENTHRMVQTAAVYVKDFFIPTPVYAESDYPYPLTDTIVDPDLSLDAPIYTFGNNRGYIWEETLQLIAQKPILGYGMGTLAYYFPFGSKDYFAHRLNTHEIISKPHNFYLGIAFGCGIPALLTLLALFALFLWKEKPLLRPVQEHTAAFDTETLKTAAWLCCLSLMVQFLVNDFMLTTCTIFWILMGLCAGLARPDAEKTDV